MQPPLKAMIYRPSNLTRHALGSLYLFLSLLSSHAFRDTEEIKDFLCSTKVMGDFIVRLDCSIPFIHYLIYNPLDRDALRVVVLPLLIDGCLSFII